MNKIKDRENIPSFIQWMRHFEGATLHYRLPLYEIQYILNRSFPIHPFLVYAGPSDVLVGSKSQTLSHNSRAVCITIMNSNDDDKTTVSFPSFSRVSIMKNDALPSNQTFSLTKSEATWMGPQWNWQTKALHRAQIWHLPWRAGKEERLLVSLYLGTTRFIISLPSEICLLGAFHPLVSGSGQKCSKSITKTLSCLRGRQRNVGLKSWRRRFCWGGLPKVSYRTFMMITILLAIIPHQNNLWDLAFVINFE